MKNRIAAAALAVAVLSAGAASAASVRIADLDLAKPADARTLEQRINWAAHRFCTADGRTELSIYQACRQAVREEARLKVAEIDRKVRYAAR